MAKEKASKKAKAEHSTKGLKAMAKEGALWRGSTWHRPDWLKRTLLISSSYIIPVPRWSLLPIDEHPEINEFTWLGTVILAIDNFDAKRLPRKINFFATGNKPAVAVAEPTPSPTAMKTRWDMNLKPIYSQSGGKQRVTVRFQLDDPQIRFLWSFGFPLTVKTPEGQILIANPRYDDEAGRWISADFLYEPGNPDFEQVAEFNIALLVDEMPDLGYCVPLIVDPRWGNGN